MSSAATFSPLSRRSSEFAPSTVRFSAPSHQASRSVARSAAGKSPTTVVIVVSIQGDEQEQFTQTLLNQGYRLQTEATVGDDDTVTSRALHAIYGSLGGRLATGGRLPAVLVEGGKQSAAVPVSDILAFEGLRLDRRRRELRLGGELVDLTKTEFDILFLLASDPGVVFTRDEIVNAVKGEGHPVTPRSVDVQLVSLRRKLGSLAGLLQTNRGVGYRFVDPNNS